MGNIVLRLLVVLVYLVICIVFCISPHISGKGKKFGVKVEKGSQYVRNMLILYNVLSILSAVCLATLCIIKNNLVFMNISLLLYIVFVVTIYLKISRELKNVFLNDFGGEFIINNPPESYLLKMINPFFYTVYLVPVLISFFIGRGDTYLFSILSVQILVTLLSYGLNVLICKLKNYIDNDDVEKVIKKNLKYRKKWNVNMFFTLLALSASVSIMYAEFKNIIYVSGIGAWLPFIVISVSVCVLLFYSFAHYKK